MTHCSRIMLRSIARTCHALRSGRWKLIDRSPQNGRPLSSFRSYTVAADGYKSQRSEASHFKIPTRIARFALCDQLRIVTSIASSETAPLRIRNLQDRSVVINSTSFNADRRHPPTSRESPDRRFESSRPRQSAFPRPILADIDISILVAVCQQITILRFLTGRTQRSGESSANALIGLAH
jgi:hypothetical protein